MPENKAKQIGEVRKIETKRNVDTLNFLHAKHQQRRAVVQRERLHQEHDHDRNADADGRNRQTSPRVAH